jgi:mono/diheme cytochrome c family protein
VADYLVRQPPREPAMAHVTFAGLPTLIAEARSRTTEQAVPCRIARVGDPDMRAIAAASMIVLFAAAFAASGILPAPGGVASAAGSPVATAPRHAGQDIFRFDTFGDEQLWTDVLRMHEVVAAVDPATALAVGLKVDVDALPPALIAALRAGEIDLTDPVVTVALLQLNAVVGVKGTVDEAGRLASVGVTCALCHSSVDDSFAPGIGKRLDGWANTDLNVGAIVALSPALDEATKAEFRAWGPGKYDPRHHAFDGTGIILLNSPSVPIVIPPIYGLRGVGFETFTGDGPISYWNSYVGVGQMGGQGSFQDPRIGLFIEQTPDLVTPKLGALLDYQLSLRPPKAPEGSFSRQAAARGRQLFRDEARCSACHQGPTFTDVLSGPDPRVPLLHDPAEVGMDPAYAERSATRRYRTTPLRGLLQHPPYFHDGSAADLLAVVDHYDELFGLDLTPGQKADLVEYLKSL